MLNSNKKSNLNQKRSSSKSLSSKRQLSKKSFPVNSRVSIMKNSQPKKRLFKLKWNKNLSHQRLSPKRKTRSSRKSLSNNRTLKLNNKMSSRINCQLSNKKMLRKLKLRLIRLKKLKRSFQRPNSRSKNLTLRRSSKPKNNNLSQLKSLR